MKIKVAGLCLLTWAFVSTSCSDYLDKTPDDATSITLEEVFSSEIYTERFLLRAYDYLPCETNYNDNDYWALGAWSGASDEMNITWTGQSWKNRKQTATVFTTITRQCLQSVIHTQMYLQEETEVQWQLLTQKVTK